MQKSIFFLLAASVTFFTSCGPSREKSADRITVLEKSLFSPDAVSFDKEKADSLMALYEDYIREFPQDSLSPGYLFKSASIAMNSGDGGKAIFLFDKYLMDYPDRDRAAMCMFFKAFVYENTLHDLDKAREIYLVFIEKYPGNDFVNDAQMALKNLGKTPEMLVQEFEAQRKADSARVADSLAKAVKGHKKR